VVFAIFTHCKKDEIWQLNYSTPYSHAATLQTNNNREKPKYKFNIFEKLFTKGSHLLSEGVSNRQPAGRMQPAMILGYCQTITFTLF